MPFTRRAAFPAFEEECQYCQCVQRLKRPPGPTPKRAPQPEETPGPTLAQQLEETLGLTLQRAPQPEEARC